jgi:hypothetical protein
MPSILTGAVVHHGIKVSASLSAFIRRFILPLAFFSIISYSTCTLLTPAVIGEVADILLIYSFCHYGVKNREIIVLKIFIKRDV